MDVVTVSSLTSPSISGLTTVTSTSQASTTTSSLAPLPTDRCDLFQGPEIGYLINTTIIKPGANYCQFNFPYLLSTEVAQRCCKPGAQLLVANNCTQYCETNKEQNQEFSRCVKDVEGRVRSSGCNFVRSNDSGRVTVGGLVVLGLVGVMGVVGQFGLI